MNRETLTDALRALGEVLADRGQRYDVVVIGGGSLLLLGLLDRPTRDLDIVALGGSDPLSSAQPLPTDLCSAVADVAPLYALDDDWLNAGPADLLRLGLPEGFASRTTSRHYGPLTVRLAGRTDQICFKLYAAVDQGPRSKHVADLRILEPTHDELVRAARWARTHDPSEGFAQVLREALAHFGVTDHGDA